VLGDRLDVPEGHQAGAHVVGPPEEPDVLHIPYTGPGVRSGAGRTRGPGEPWRARSSRDRTALSTTSSPRRRPSRSHHLALAPGHLSFLGAVRSLRPGFLGFSPPRVTALDNRPCVA
jgi:hypothetical protein